MKRLFHVLTLVSVLIVLFKNYQGDKHRPISLNNLRVTSEFRENSPEV